MRKVIWLLLFPILSAQAQKTEFSINDLVSFTGYSSNKFDNFLSRKGFTPNDTTFINASASNYRKISKNHEIEKVIEKYDANNTSSLLFQTTSFNEFTELQQQLIKDDFIFPETTANNAALPLYQKANVTVQPIIKQEQNKTVYSFLIKRKQLPRAKDILYAEDLLQLNSHENLCAVFGKGNVKKDAFYFTEKEVNKCSVLFPNTSMQVIFIWNDEVNNRDIAFLIIGGSLNTKNSLNFYKTIELNRWHSRQGLYSGMSLKELYKINGRPINFYGWETEESGLISKDNSGNIDFNSIGAQLNCLDCNEDKYYTSDKIINSDEVLKDNRRVYVTSLIILPVKNK